MRSSDCIKSDCILNDVSPDELKSVDVTTLSKESDPDGKTNNRLISVLPSLNKVYEKKFYKQLN